MLTSAVLLVAGAQSTAELVAGARGEATAQPTAADGLRGEENGDEGIDGVVPGGRAGDVAGPQVSAAGALLWDPAADAVLVDVEAEVPRPMASTTKIMTALLVLEGGTVDDEVEISAAAVQAGQLPGVARVGLTEGEALPMRSLLVALLLESANDAAVAIAEHVSGDVDAFVAAMNERADELGLDETGFVDPSGLTNDPDHVASPADLVRLAEEAMGHEEFAEIVGMSEAEPDGLPRIDNRNELLDTFDGATGVKTGFTSRAGLTLVAAAEREDRRLYAVVLDSDDHFADSAELLRHGFERWASERIEGEVASWRTSGGTTPLEVARPVEYAVPADGEVELVADPPATLPAGTPAGTEAGTAELRVDGVPAGSVELATAEEVPRPTHEGSAAIGAGLQDALRDLSRAGLEEVRGEPPFGRPVHPLVVSGRPWFPGAPD
ncbi:D-alanyl-D-alanine carboxypeptidase family protein [Egibacter rhizosphaerae]|uniref:D-alanyl-D-alanine carboxypeptidase family protein n=1 Tax=Egibacter rhizosphaerae TaxID=1670831 RepID=UPI0013F1644B|nr:D-alanyl-D-alanine carboxypeptidase family protein [Egibacter rhizosphaerae]